MAERYLGLHEGSESGRPLYTSLKCGSGYYLAEKLGATAGRDEYALAQCGEGKLALKLGASATSVRDVYGYSECCTLVIAVVNVVQIFNDTSLGLNGHFVFAALSLPASSGRNGGFWRSNSGIPVSSAGFDDGGADNFSDFATAIRFDSSMFNMGGTNRITLVPVHGAGPRNLRVRCGRVVHSGGVWSMPLASTYLDTTWVSSGSGVFLDFFVPAD